MSPDFINGIPKAELHVHIEGTLEPEMVFCFAQRNGVKLRYKSVEELRAAYNFNNLQDFLNIYYEGTRVLLTKQDFFDLTYAYLQKAHSQNIIHTEIFFDPQTHTERGVAFSTIIEGIDEALKVGRKEFGISSKLIMCFLRHLSEASAMQTLKSALPYKDRIIAVGLDSSEIDNPPSKFQRVFAEAQLEGLLGVAHAGEEGPVNYVWEALYLLNVSRIDHGNHAWEDEKLVRYLVGEKIPLTMCPLSNLKLKVIKDMSEHPIKAMIERGLLVTANSDDPAYFGGYLNENLIVVAQALKLSRKQIVQLVINSFTGSFLNDDEKIEMTEKVEEYNRMFGK